MSWLSNLRLRHKFGVIALLAAVMLLIPTGMFMQRALASLQQLDREVAGLPPAGTLMRLARLSAQHRGLANGQLNGDAAAGAAREQAWGRLQAQRHEAEAAFAAYGDAALAGRLAALWQEQQALAQAVAGGGIAPAQSFERHTRLIDAQLALLYDLSADARLVLHPAPAGYHLQDAVLNQLPQVAEAIGRLRGSGMGLLAKGSASALERARIAALIERTLISYAAAERAVGHGLAADAALQTKLQAPLAQAQGSTTALLALARAQLVGAEALGHPAADWWARATEAIEHQVALADAAEAALAQDLVALRAAERRGLALLAAALALLAGTAGTLLWRIASTTTASIGQAIVLADAVAAGDLTRQVAAPPPGSRDEGVRLVAALGRMAAALHAVVGTVRDNAGQVATASAQIAQGNLDLSARTETQASALQQTAASMEQLRTTIGHSAEGAGQAARLAQQASEVAVRGGDSVAELATTMEQIRAGSQRMGEIIGTIDALAFQTNILALNAAVEAARAGDQGRGFAVVASEVRSLAQRSATAAREIRGLIAASEERVTEGSQRGQDAAATMQQVVGAIRRVSALIGDVSAAVKEQNLGVGQVGEAVTQMDRTTQQNAALVEESAAAAESLRQQAESLQKAVAVFRTA